MQIKFMYNGIKIDGKLYKGHWSSGPWVSGEEMITFYRSGYDHMPNIGLEVENNTDSMTDYFEEDRIRFKPGPYYNEALAAFRLQENRRKEWLLTRATY